MINSGGTEQPPEAEGISITDAGRSLMRELAYGHNPLAYLCSESGDDFVAGELCMLCPDAMEAYTWKMRALRAEAALAERDAT